MTTARSTVLRRTLLAVVVAAASVAAVYAFAGGFDIRLAGLRVSNHSASRPLLLAIFAVALLWLCFDRVSIRADLRSLDGLLERGAPWVAASAAAAALAVGLAWGTRAAGGSDSYCYIGQAEEFVAGRAILREPLAREVPWPRADLVFAPVGWIPAARGGGAVPMCAPGLSLIMAAVWKVAGQAAIHVVVPALGALAVWLVYVLGRMMRGAMTGAIAAVLLAASPIFLFQVVQPMSDVPAAAFWTAALVLVGRPGSRRELGAGLMASLALLTRPNLAPAVIPVAVFVFFRPYPDALRATQLSRVAALSRFVFALIPGCALIAWLNQVRYGSPFRTGYGDVESLFSLGHVLPNALRYSTWVADAQTPLMALALAAPFLGRRHAGDSGAPAAALRWMGAAFIVTILACYLPYTVFDAWWYTRFLLPALPVALALTAVSAVELASRTPARGVILLVMIVALTAGYVVFARSHGAFGMRDFERRYITTGTYVARALPENAVVITIQESGAVRHYGRRPAALWDAIEPSALDAALDDLARLGRHPYVVVEDWEARGFRERFAGQSAGALDWPPRAVIHDRVNVHIYDPGDRVRFRSGMHIATDDVRPGGRGSSRSRFAPK